MKAAHKVRTARWAAWAGLATIAFALLWTLASMLGVIR